MRLHKKEALTFRLHPILKSKFNIAIGFLSITEVLGTFVQDYVREYEKESGIIEVTTSKDTQYDIVTKMYGVKLDRKRFEELIEAYPKTRKGIAIYGK